MNTLDIGRSLDSPITRAVLLIIGAGLIFVLVREVRKIPPKLFVLMATAFIDMMGLLMVIPLIPFYVKKLDGPNTKKGRNKRDLAEQVRADPRPGGPHHPGGGTDRLR